MTRPRVLALTTFFPWPQDHGDALRRMLVLEALESCSDLTALVVRRPETTDSQVEELRQRLARSVVHVFGLSPVAAPGAKGRRALHGVLRATPPWVYKQWSEDLRQHLGQHRANEYDAVVLVGEAGAAYLRHLPRGRLILDKSNVLLASELDAIRTVRGWRGRLRPAITLPFTARFEWASVGRADEVWVTSADEAGRLRRHFTAAKVSVIPSAVPSLGRASGLDRSSRTLLWMSTFGYTPNWDGLTRFLAANGEHLAGSGYTLRVVGAGATDAQIRFLQSQACVDYRGFAPDLRQACRDVALAVVPVWSGAGIKLKTLTLMALGVPVVATPVALEGIPHEAAAMVAGSPGDFQRAIGRLQPADLEAAAARAETILETHFSRAAFTERVQRALSPPPTGGGQP